MMRGIVDFRYELAKGEDGRGAAGVAGMRRSVERTNGRLEIMRPREMKVR
jgi:hypothetical protein